ncbi:MAG: hypothetical protein EZS28_015073 [Streblomastix strix]|uniref:Uncharacterized protein n=1 Tax=Streblomastix strix TaxID=222440 RepID=A0A5J4W3W4_9EUKA|nr:MAG: hypothetical protein EZS28_015073 [Streblomastix strix]
MTQASEQNVQVLFSHIRDGASLNTASNQFLTVDRDANGNDFNVFASDHEITVTDADAGPALRTPPMQEIQYFIMRFIEMHTGKSTFAIDFWANPIIYAQILDNKAQSLQAPKVTIHAEVPPHQILNNAANCRLD